MLRFSLYILLYFALAASLYRSPSFNIEDFGAKGDNTTLSTDAIVKAINSVEKNGGGTVIIPKGIFITMPFNMTSHMTLFLEEGATLRGPTESQLGGFPDFPNWDLIPALPSYGRGRDHHGPRRTSLIHGENLVDIKVTSATDRWGTIDGYGEPFWRANRERKEKYTRGHLIEFINCTNVEISNVYLRNSPFWTVHPVYSTHVVVRNIDIWAPGNAPNTDGVDPDSCNDVLIENFTFHGGDDMIAIKSGWDCYGNDFGMPTQNVLIRNVTCIHGRFGGVAIGSEMSGGMRNITVRDSDFSACLTPFQIKYSGARGGYVKDVTYENNLVGHIGTAFQIDSGYNAPNPECQKKDFAVPITNIVYVNTTQKPGSTCGSLIHFKGLEKKQIDHVRVEGANLPACNGKVSCEYVSGTYKDAPGAEKCSGLNPEQQSDTSPTDV